MDNTTPLWQEMNIGQGLKLTSGFPFLSKLFSNQEGFPLIRIRDILDSKIETYYRGSYLPGYVIRKGDVLIGMDGDFNIARWNNEDALLNQRVLKVETYSSEDLSLDFIYYWLQPYIKKVNDLTAATTVKHLSVKDLYKATGTIPNSRTQKKIATILSTIDTTIEKTEALIEKYQQIKAGLMHDLFTRGVLSNGQLRPSREEAPELYHKTEIGWIPKEWGVTGLENIGRAGVSFIKTGPFGSALKGEHWRSEGHPVITIGALGEGCFLEEELLYVDNKDAKRLIAFQLKMGDVVFSRVADVGRSVVIRQSQEKWIMSSNLMRIAVNEAEMNPDVVQLALAYDTRLKSQIRAKVNSGGRDVANSDILSQLKFAWPQISEQDLITQRAKSISERIGQEQKRKRKLTEQKLGLMQDLLSGKVPVTVDGSEAVNE